MIGRTPLDRLEADIKKQQDAFPKLPQTTKQNRRKAYQEYLKALANIKLKAKP